MDRKRTGEVTEYQNKRPKTTFENLKQEYEKTTPWRGNVQAKLNSAAPFHFFLTRVQDERKTYDEDLSITFPEFLDSSLGELEHSVHFTFMVEVGWLLAQYAVAGVKNPSVWVYHGTMDDELEHLPAFLKDRVVHIDTGDPYGHHHTKMSLLFYKDGSARVIILTANLVESDWENRTQGVWISPLLPVLQVNNKSGESITNFKSDLLDYLKCYRGGSLNCWIERLQNVDMSSVMVCFLASVPGTHQNDSYGYRKLRHLLSEHISNPNPDWNIIAQCSSIGSLGPNPRTWLCGPFGRSLTKNKDVPLSLIYPSLSNVKSSLDGMLGGACLPYTTTTHSRQTWLKDHLWQWKSDGRFRSRAVPHIKTYAQLSPNGKRAGWFVMTSANLSKAAWGGPVTTGLHIRSYEVGVLFLPKFLTGETEFRVRCDGEFNSDDFPFPYDTPLTPYTSTDQPFFYNKCFSNPRN